MATHDPAPHGTPAPLAPAHGHHVVPGADKAPAFIGLIVGGIALFAILYGVVHLTNQQFKGHGEGGEKPAAAAQH